MMTAVKLLIILFRKWAVGGCSDLYSASHGLTKTIVYFQSQKSLIEMREVLSKLCLDHSAHKLSILTTQPRS